MSKSNIKQINNRQELIEYVREKYGPKSSHMYINKTSWSVCDGCGSVLDPEMDDSCISVPECYNYAFKEEYMTEMKIRGIRFEDRKYNAKLGVYE